jgi:sterol desaturase/sphingolipid hydroxylase (fatty acid hydroxylase superfamily)
MNKFRKRFEEAFRLYFILVTLISILLMVLGLMFDSNRVFGYEVFLSPLIYAAIGVIPCFFTDSEKELSMKILIIRRAVVLLVIEAMMLTLAYSAESIPTERKGVVPGIAIGIVIVFILSSVIEYVFELAGARELNEALSVYQNSESDLKED